MATSETEQQRPFTVPRSLFRTRTFEPSEGQGPSGARDALEERGTPVSLSEGARADSNASTRPGTRTPLQIKEVADWTGTGTVQDYDPIRHAWRILSTTGEDVFVPLPAMQVHALDEAGGLILDVQVGHQRRLIQEKLALSELVTFAPTLPRETTSSSFWAQVAYRVRTFFAKEETLSSVSSSASWDILLQQAERRATRTLQELEKLLARHTQEGGERGESTQRMRVLTTFASHVDLVHDLRQLAVQYRDFRPQDVLQWQDVLQETPDRLRHEDARLFLHLGHKPLLSATVTLRAGALVGLERVPTLHTHLEEQPEDAASDEEKMARAIHEGFNPFATTADTGQTNPVVRSFPLAPLQGITTLTEKDKRETRGLQALTRLAAQHAPFFTYWKDHLTHTLQTPSRDEEGGQVMPRHSLLTPEVHVLQQQRDDLKATSLKQVTALMHKREDGSPVLTLLTGEGVEYLSSENRVASLKGEKRHTQSVRHVALPVDGWPDGHAPGLYKMDQVDLVSWAARTKMHTDDLHLQAVLAPGTQITPLAVENSAFPLAHVEAGFVHVRRHDEKTGLVDVACWKPIAHHCGTLEAQASKEGVLDNPFLTQNGGTSDCVLRAVYTPPGLAPRTLALTKAIPLTHLQRGCFSLFLEEVSGLAKTHGLSPSDIHIESLTYTLQALAAQHLLAQKMALEEVAREDASLQPAVFMAHLVSPRLPGGITASPYRVTTAEETDRPLHACITYAPATVGATLKAPVAPGQSLQASLPENPHVYDPQAVLLQREAQHHSALQAFEQKAYPQEGGIRLQNAREKLEQLQRTDEELKDAYDVARVKFEQGITRREQVGAQADPLSVQSASEEARTYVGDLDQQILDALLSLRKLVQQRGDLEERRTLLEIEGALEHKEGPLSTKKQDLEREGVRLEALIQEATKRKTALDTEEAERKLLHDLQLRDAWRAGTESAREHQEHVVTLGVKKKPARTQEEEARRVQEKAFQRERAEEAHRRFEEGQAILRERTAFEAQVRTWQALDTEGREALDLGIASGLCTFEALKADVLGDGEFAVHHWHPKSLSLDDGEAMRFLLKHLASKPRMEESAKLRERRNPVLKLRAFLPTPEGYRLLGSTAAIGSLARDKPVFLSTVRGVPALQWPSLENLEPLKDHLLRHLTALADTQKDDRILTSVLERAKFSSVRGEKGDVLSQHGVVFDVVVGHTIGFISQDVLDRQGLTRNASMKATHMIGHQGEGVLAGKMDLLYKDAVSAQFGEIKVEHWNMFHESIAPAGAEDQGRLLMPEYLKPASAWVGRATSENEHNGTLQRLLQTLRERRALKRVLGTREAPERAGRPRIRI